MRDLVEALKVAPGSIRPLGKRQKARIIENLETDSVSARGLGWSYPDDISPGRGDNIKSTYLSETIARLTAAGCPAVGSSFSDLLKNTVNALSPMDASGDPDFLCRVGTHVPARKRLWNVTTISALRYSWEIHDRDSLLRAFHDWVTSPDPVVWPGYPKDHKLSLGGRGSLVWISDESPLELLRNKGIALGTQDAALALIRELALPGFETPSRRTEAMGMACVEFDPDQLVDGPRTGGFWKPTALDALSFKGYLFLPGHTAQDSGSTWPLRANLRDHHKRRNGLREFVHPSIRVPDIIDGHSAVHLLGFLDPGVESAWNALPASS